MGFSGCIIVCCSSTDSCQDIMIWEMQKLFLNLLPEALVIFMAATEESESILYHSHQQLLPPEAGYMVLIPLSISLKECLLLGNATAEECADYCVASILRSYKKGYNAKPFPRWWILKHGYES